jgi:amidase
MTLAPGTEFPKGQAQLTDTLAGVTSDVKYEEAKEFLRTMAGAQGFDKIFADHDVDLVAGPLDGRIVTVAAAAGYPCGVVPLGYAENLNGRAYGMVVVAAGGREDKIIEFMSAWEASSPGLRKSPPQLVSWNSARLRYLTAGGCPQREVVNVWFVRLKYQ